MTNEIKEILEDLKTFDENSGCPYELSGKDCKLLLDYITNLQKENERLNNGFCELKVKCNNGEIDCTNEEYESMIQANMKGSLLLDDYKSRNEKAIEYIENDLKSFLYSIEYKTLLNILNGGDE